VPAGILRNLKATEVEDKVPRRASWLKRSIMAKRVATVKLKNKGKEGQKSRYNGKRSRKELHRRKE
jgi:hypothetical protein